MWRNRKGAAVALAAIGLMVAPALVWSQRPGGAERRERGWRPLRGEQRPVARGERGMRPPRMAPGARGMAVPGGLWGGPLRPGVSAIGANVIARNMAVFDKDKDGALSREEYEAAAREVFEILDADRDGKLVAEEMSADLSRAFVPPARRARKLLQLFDRDGDGKIAPEECPVPPQFFAEIDKNKSGAIERDDLIELSASKALIFGDPARRGALLLAAFDKNGDGKLGEQELGSLKWIMRQADADGNGVLDGKEVKAVPPLPADHPLRQAEDAIARLDQDGDKMLSQDEFRVRGARFDQVDENKDGLIEAAELVAWFKSGRGRFFAPRSPEQMIARILDRFDLNGDDKLTRDELKPVPERMWKRWDLNDDGVVEASEIEQAMRAPRRQLLAPGGQGRQGALRELMRNTPAEVIKKRDQDDDGKLTVEELGIERRIFDRLDADGDGKLTVEEISNAQERLRTRGGRPWGGERPRRPRRP